MPGSGIAASSGSTMCNFLRNCQTDFQIGCTILRSHQHCSIPLSPHHSQHLMSSEFLILAILNGVRWNLRVVLICISLMTKNAELGASQPFCILQLRFPCFPLYPIFNRVIWFSGVYLLEFLVYIRSQPSVGCRVSKYLFSTY